MGGKRCDILDEDCGLNERGNNSLATVIDSMNQDEGDIFICIRVIESHIRLIPHVGKLPRLLTSAPVA